MILERTLPTVWQLRGRDVPALAPVTSRAHTVVVDDVEMLCAALVVDVSRCGAPYAATELCDLYEGLAFLLGRTVEVLPRYDPTRGRRIHDPWTAGFKAWLHDELLCDLHDQWRSWYGRKGQKRLPMIVSTEHTGGVHGDSGDEYDARSSRERRSRGAADPAAGDRGDSGLDVLRRRLLEGGDRALLREVAALGLSEDPGARGRLARPGRRAARGGVKAAA